MPIESRDLVVSDGAGRLSRERLQSLADLAQKTFDGVLAFWSADAGVGRFGKISVVFDEPRRDVYSSVFYWERKGNQRKRVVQVFGTEGAPQMMAHKLASAIFPQEDKLIRNLMGILTEANVGDPLTFPMCGFPSDEWVMALRQMKAYLPLSELGPDHESWGMKDSGGGKLSISDKARQHKAYAETGSFGDYLYRTYGLNKIKQLQRLSHERARPWQEVFGIGLPELEANWLQSLTAAGKTAPESVATLMTLFERNPGTACAEAQKLVTGRPWKTRGETGHRRLYETIDSVVSDRITGALGPALGTDAAGRGPSNPRWRHPAAARARTRESESGGRALCARGEFQFKADQAT